MRIIKKRVSKAFLFACFGLSVAIIAFAGIVRAFDVPGPPGRPSAFDIEADWAKLRFKKPQHDGGTPITSYIVEYHSLKMDRWLLERRVEPQYSVDDVIQCAVDNRVGKLPVIFRARAVNKAGKGDPSLPSDEITFRNPF